jgi:hypothetical protein
VVLAGPAEEAAAAASIAAEPAAHIVEAAREAHTAEVAEADTAAAEEAPDTAEPAWRVAQVLEERKKDTLFSMAALRGHNGDRPS